MKQMLFAYLNAHLAEPRRRYAELIDNPGHVERLLARGAEKARAHSRLMLEAVRRAVGIRALGA
jgi:tryptophanyl-tRNA synthetase